MYHSRANSAEGGQVLETLSRRMVPKSRNKKSVMPGYMQPVTKLRRSERSLRSSAGRASALSCPSSASQQEAEPTPLDSDYESDQDLHSDLQNQL